MPYKALKKQLLVFAKNRKLRFCVPKTGILIPAEAMCSGVQPQQASKESPEATRAQPSSSEVFKFSQMWLNVGLGDPC